MLELWILAKIELLESARTTHKMLQFRVMCNVQFLERSGITLNIRHLWVVLYVERSKLWTIVTIYPDKINQTGKVELGELVSRTPDTCEQLVMAEIPIRNLVIHTIYASELLQILNTFERFDTHILTIDIADVENLISIQSTVAVFIIVTSRNQSPELRVWECFFVDFHRHNFLSYSR